MWHGGNPEAETTEDSTGRSMNKIGAACGSGVRHGAGVSKANLGLGGFGLSLHRHLSPRRHIAVQIAER